MVTWVTQVPKGLHPIGKLCSPGAGCSIRSLPLHRQVRTDPQDEEDGLTGQVLSKETRPRRLPGGRAQRHPKCPECSAQLSSVSQSCLTLCNPTHGLQHARPPCPSPPPGIYPNSCLLSRWCHPTISSSVTPFSSGLQSFPVSGAFPMSQFFTSGGQSIGVSASASVLPMNTQDWSPLGWTGWISLQSKGLSRIFSNITVQKHPFLGTQLSLWTNSHIHTWLLQKPQLWLDGPKH